MVEVPSVIEALSDEECYLYAILQDHSGVDFAEFAMVDDSNNDGVFRCWAFQWSWFRCNDALQVDSSARSIGKSLSIKLRAMVFPFIHPGQEMVITAPELIHLEPVVSLIESQFYSIRLLREMIPLGRSAVTHRPFQLNAVNGSRIMGRIPQRDGRGAKGCVGEDTPILTREGYKYVQDVNIGDFVLTHQSRWREVKEIHVDHSDCYEVKGQSSYPLVVSCDHRFWVLRILQLLNKRKASYR